MNSDGADTYRKVVDWLLRAASPRKRSLPISVNTEIYADLGIYGDDIVELVWWLEKEFGVRTKVNPFRYAPTEGAFLRVIRAVRKLAGVEQRYEGLTVRDVIAAIEAKHWPDELRR
jgi:hypothetical protein